VTPTSTVDAGTSRPSTRDLESQATAAATAIVQNHLSVANNSFLTLRAMYPDCVFGTGNGVFASPRSAGVALDSAIATAKVQAPLGEPIIGVAVVETGRSPREVVAVITSASCPEA